MMHGIFDETIFSHHLNINNRVESMWKSLKFFLTNIYFFLFEKLGHKKKCHAQLTDCHSFDILRSGLLGLIC